MLRLFLILTLALISAPAAAGIRATYGAPLSRPMVVEIADNGDVDADLGSGRHLLVVSGRAYIVENRLTGPVVDRLDDLTATLPTFDAVAIDGIESLAERRGTAEISGRAGQAWFLRGATGRRAEEPIAVISSDPSLRPLGAVMRRVFAAESALRSFEGHFPPQIAVTEAVLLRLLDDGAPLKFGDHSLRALEQIAVARFALPAEPESVDAMQLRRAGEAGEEGPQAPNRMISRAVFAEGRLWLLTDRGELSSLADGERTRRIESPGEAGLDLCVVGGSPVVLTGRRDGERWTVRRRRGGVWVTDRSVERSGDTPIALACGNGGDMLLTSRRLIDLAGATAPVTLSAPLEPALVRAVVLVTPDAAWVGINRGEWGGGLRRIDRRSGTIATVERNAAGGLCSGPLNTACDPVNGLVTIPWRPSCVAAAIGLIHFEAHGRIASICPDGVTQLFVASDGRDPGDSRATAEAASGGSGAIAFFGLAAARDALIAAGHDGLYRIEANGAGTRRPWPRFTEVDGILVSFALPDVVLVMSELNRRASVSGIAPLMVVR